MAAAIYNITIEQGVVYEQEFIWQTLAGVVVPITGYSAKFQVRHSANSTSKLVALSSDTSGITIIEAAGSITVKIPSAVTSTLTHPDAVYALEVTAPSGDITRWVSGKVIVSPQLIN